MSIEPEANKRTCWDVWDCPKSQILWMSLLGTFERSDLATHVRRGKPVCGWKCLPEEVLCSEPRPFRDRCVTEPAIGSIHEASLCLLSDSDSPNPLKATFEALWVRPGLPRSVCQCSTLTHSASVTVSVTEHTILPKGNVRYFEG